VIKYLVSYQGGQILGIVSILFLLVPPITTNKYTEVSDRGSQTRP